MYKSRLKSDYAHFWKVRFKNVTLDHLPLLSRIFCRVVATHHDIFLHDIRAFQFLNAIEWNWFDDDADFDRCYEVNELTNALLLVDVLFAYLKVTLRATEDSVFMSWTKNQLLQARQCLPEVLSVFLQITANDALRQIYFVANDGQESTREVATRSVPTVSYQNV